MILHLFACAAEPAAVDPLRVPLRWVSGAEEDDWANARAGVAWSLSLLGAEPPADGAAFDEVVVGDGVVDFTLDLGAAGFPDAALPAVEAAVAPLLASDEVAVTGRMDVGRMLVLTLYAPGRYYAITGACPDVDGWRARIREESVYGVTTSQLVAGERWVRFQAGAAAVADVALLAEEGEGSLAGDFVVTERETVDVMANGQQRFAVYDADGALIPASTHTPAGQPGKCMWCHELTIQRGTPENAGVSGALTWAEFDAEADALDALLAAWRGGRDTEVPWATPDVHEWGELVVLQFLRPPAARIRREYGDVALDALDARVEDEHPQLGELYWRAAVDAAYAPFLPLPVPEDFREPDAALSMEGVDALEECG